MRAVTTYYAYDETEFETEDECLEYEEHLRSILSAVVFFDEHKQVQVAPTLPDIESSSFYMKILDEGKAAELFDWLGENISFLAPDKGSFGRGEILRWDTDRSAWIGMRKEAQAILDDLAALELESVRYTSVPNNEEKK